MKGQTPIVSVFDPATPNTGALPVQATVVPPRPADAAEVVGPTQCVVNPLQLPQTKGLTPEQRTALCGLASGMTATAAAELAGVDRSTLYRWRTADDAFVKALNAWREQTQEIAQNQLVAMTQLATANVYAALRKGDVRTALVLLKSLGTLTPNAGKKIAVDRHEQILNQDHSELARKLGIRIVPDKDDEPAKGQPKHGPASQSMRS